MLKLLLYCFILHFVFSQSHNLSHGFGKSYMRNSRLCHQWICISDKLGLPDDLPPKEKYTEVLKGLLPQGPWQGVVKDIVDTCYEDRPRAYTNTCPGQALLHCTVDQMMQFCPEGSLRKDDGCTPLQSLAGFKYMFSQSRYNELTRNLPSEHMPPWFMNNFFSSKCCNLPDIFEMDELVECGFNSFVYIHVYKPAPRDNTNTRALALPKPMSTKHILRRPIKTISATDDDNIKIEIQFDSSEIENDTTTSTTVATMPTSERRPIKTISATDDDIIKIEIQFDSSEIENDTTTSTTVATMPTSENNTAETTPRYRVNVVDISEPVTAKAPTWTTTQTQATTTQIIDMETTQTPATAATTTQTQATTTQIIDVGTTQKEVDNSEEVQDSQIVIQEYVVPSETQTTTTENIISEDYIEILEIEKPIDPLECCDLTDFIQPEWRSECDFHMSWDKVNRLSIQNDSVHMSTTMAPTGSRLQDVMVVPQSCDKTTCVFKKLDLITDNGTLNLDGYWKLLDKMALANTQWMKAKMRAVDKCFNNPKEYVGDCDINRVLACTFDLLSENCPHAKSYDPCSHALLLREDITCQISSSKYRPKKRRLFCGIPNIVKPEVLEECGITSLSKMEYVPIFSGKSIAPNWWNKSQYSCKGLTDSSKCVLKKMNVLSKYGFLDYFKMKDRIRTFIGVEKVWSRHSDLYMNALTSLPMYGEECSTTKKFLNVVDTMLSTCPLSKRKTNFECNRIFTDMEATLPKPRPSLDKLNRLVTQLLKHPATHAATKPPRHSAIKPQSKKTNIKPQISSFVYNVSSHDKQPVTHKTPLYDFGILNSKDAPKVEIIEVRPRLPKEPLVVLPVYLRKRLNGQPLH